MNSTRMWIVLFSVTLLLRAEETVEIRRLPSGAVQPQAVVDPTGAVHLVYLQGQPKSDVFYQRIPLGGQAHAPIQVNRQPKNAIATGTIRGAQISIGRDGFVHVVWNGSPREVPSHGEHAAKPKVDHAAAPLYYSRLTPAATAFEPERNLMGETWELDGGGTVASDDRGRVYVFWHASPKGSHGEASRRVFLSVSSDDGNSFAPERPVDDPPKGVCGCCGMDAFSDNQGNAFALFRTATGAINRNMTLLVSTDAGQSFASKPVQAWQVGNCPMSSAILTGGAKGVIAGWESYGEVFFARLDAKTLALANPIRASSAKGSKHPALAVNAKGQVLVAWSEGTGWNRGGSVGWGLFSEAGEVLKTGQGDGLPVWSFPACYARPDGSFVVMF